jgi:site-specific recombinase XerD
MRMKKQPEPTICYMSAEGVACLLRQPDSRTRAGYRDMLILTLLYDSGARVSEIIKTRVGDIRVQSPAKIILHGKGSKDRIAPLSEKTVTLIKHYLNSENLGRPEHRDKLLFVNHSGEQLTRAGAAYILHKCVDMARAKEPTLIPAKFSPHCMRHSKAMHLLQAGVALIYIRDFLGHNSITATEAYAKADGKTKRAALDMAYSDMHISDPTLTASWNNDASLMRFLENLCAN